MSLFQFLAAAQGGTPSLNQPEILTRNHELGVTQLESLYLIGRSAPARGLGLDAACQCTERPGSDSDAAAAAAEWPWQQSL